MTVETANRLVQLRKENGLSQEELALRLHISRQAVSKWERAESSPDTDNLIALAKLYHLTLDELLFDQGGVPAEYTVDALEEEYPVGAEPPQAGGNIPQEGVPEANTPKENTPEENTPEENTPEGPAGSYFQEKEEREKRERREKSLLHRFPYPVLVTAVYLCLGVFLNLWHPGWLIFLTVPLHYLPDSMKTPKKLLCSPVMITLIYLLLGFYFNLWHPGWLVFLAIPLFGAISD